MMTVFTSTILRSLFVVSKSRRLSKTCPKWVCLGAVVVFLASVVCSVLIWRYVSCPPAVYVDELLSQRLYVTVTPGGRTGNHLFKYASLLGIAERTRRTPFIPPSYPLLELFELTHVQEVDSRCWPYVKERSAGIYDGIFYTLPLTNATLFEFLQSWKYFKAVESQLRAEFRFRAYIDKQAKGLFKRYVESVTDVNRHVVGVHIRHGDYMYNRFKKLGYAVPSLQYYKRAMAYMKRKLGNVTFLVVGDDLPWAKVNLQGPDVVISEPHPAGIHLALLSRCDHMIQSTGTFSWWAGWFVSGHVVYFKDYPERGSWLDGRVVKDDYYLPHWVAL